MLPIQFEGESVTVDTTRAISHVLNGIPRTAAGRIAVTDDGTPVHFQNGLPFDEYGRLCVEWVLPPYTNAISFLDKPGRHPAFSHTRATVGALCQQFDGSFYQPEIGEIGSHGMRRVRNLLNNTDTLSTQGVTVEAADYWLSFTGTGSVAVSGVATDSLAGAGVSDRVSKKITAGAAGTMTLTVTGSVTNAMLTKSRVDQTIPDPEYVSRGVVTAEMLGPEKVTNGAFSADSDWTKGTGWTISGGSASKTAGTASGLDQAVDVIDSHLYLVAFDATVTAGTFTPQFTGGTTVSGTAINASGSYQQVLVAGSSSDTLRFLANSAAAGTIDNVSMKRLSYHGWGIDGVRCFATDEYGNRLDLETPLGPELVTNGRFDDDSDWTKGTGWTISEGTANAASSSANTYQDAGLEAGKTYRVTFALSNVTAGVAAVSAGGNIDAWKSGNGNYSADIVCGGNSNVEIKCSGFTGSVDNVSVREVYPVRAAGAVRNPAATNLLTQNQNVASWAARGTASVSSADDGSVQGGYLQLRGIDAVSVNDVYRISTGFTASGNLGVALLIRPVDTSGVLRIQNAASGIGNGQWTIDLSALPVGRWSLLNTSHPAVTVLNDFVSASTSGGLLFSSVAGGPLDFDISVATMIEGTLYCPVVIPTGATAVAVSADAMSLDPTAWGYDQNGGVWVPVHTPTLDSTVASGGQALIDLYTSSTDRALLYNRSGDLGVYAVDGGAVQWADAASAAEWVANQRQVAAWRIEADDGRLMSDGVDRLADAALTVPAAASISLGGSSNSDSLDYAGAIEAVYYFPPGTITDAELLALSAGDLPLIPELA